MGKASSRVSGKTQGPHPAHLCRSELLLRLQGRILRAALLVARSPATRNEARTGHLARRLVPRSSEGGTAQALAKGGADETQLAREVDRKCRQL